MSSWWFPEYRPVGVELGTRASVAAYDARQGTDPAVDDALLDRLGVGAGTVLVDLACGTGSFAVQAARRGAEVHGVDVGDEMLAFASRRAHDAGVTVHWHHPGGMLHLRMDPRRHARPGRAGGRRARRRKPDARRLRLPACVRRIRCARR